MATYKVIQDIEAEDKLLGPLTFRQFVYAGIGAGFLFLAWFVGSRGAVVLAPIFVLPGLLAGFFAFPWGRDQPTETWALAKLRFWVKPRKRMWDQSGIKELVTITVPKKVQRTLTKGFSQTEVRSRLQALAGTLDSHGWIIKQAGVGPFAMGANADPDRLLSASPTQSAPQEISAAEDMFDEQNNPRAQRVSDLVDASSKQRRQKVIEELNQAQKAASEKTPEKTSWFLNQPGGTTSIPNDMVTFSTQVVNPGVSQDGIQQAATPTPPPVAVKTEEQLIKELEARKQESPIKSYYEHMPKILPLSEQKKMAAEKAEAQTRARAEAAAKQKAAQTEMQSPARQAAIRQLASNNDFSVATLARQANEVVVNLH